MEMTLFQERTENLFIKTLLMLTDLSKLKKNYYFRIFQRTEGISSTDVLGKILDLDLNKLPEKATSFQPTSSVSFVHRALEFQKFMDLKDPKSGDKIVYAPGSFDLLNPGHVKFLEQAKTLGDYLIVGVYPDSVTF